MSLDAAIALWMTLPISFYCLYRVMEWLADEWDWWK